MSHNSAGLMAHLVQIGWVLLSLRVCASAVVLGMIEYDQGPGLTCHQGLTDCSVEDEDPMRPDSGADVNRLELKPLLCCRKGKDCRPCLEIHIHFTITVFHDDQDQSGEGGIYESTDRVEGGGSSQDILLYQTASINMCYNVPNFLNICKRLEFTLPSVAPEDHKPEMWLSLVVSDKLLFGSPVFVTTKSTHRNLTLPSEKDVCSPALKRIVRECDVPTLHTVIDWEKGVATLQMDKDDINYSLSMGMCMKYGEKRDCIFQKLNSTNKFTIPLHFVTPCLCFQVWWLKPNAVRVNTCPFLNHTEFLKNMWDNVSLSVVPAQTNGNDTALSWELTAPCRVEAELWLCRMGEGGAGQKCGEVEGSRQDNINVDWQENFQAHRVKGEFNNIKPHPSLCVLGKVRGMARELGPWCPYAGLDLASRERWSLAVLVSMLLICLAILGAYLLHGSLKSWVWKCFKDEDIRGAVGGGQVVLLYPRTRTKPSQGWCAGWAPPCRP